MKDSILCQGCGIEAPTKFVEFHQNVGMLVMRQSRTVKGNLCKKCVHSNFWKMTGITLGVGWLGTISLFIAPVFILNNVFRYVGASRMPPVPPGAGRPSIDNEEIARMFPLVGPLFDRLNLGEPFARVARELAPQANVTPGQLTVYAAQVAQAHAAQRPPMQRPTGGFPVGMPGASPSPPPLPNAGNARV